MSSLDGKELTTNPRVSIENPQIVVNLIEPAAVEEKDPNSRKVSALKFRIEPEFNDELAAKRKTSAMRQTVSGVPVYGKSYYLVDYDNEARRNSKIRDSKAMLSGRILEISGNDKKKTLDSGAVDGRGKGMAPDAAFGDSNAIPDEMLEEPGRFSKNGKGRPKVSQPTEERQTENTRAAPFRPSQNSGQRPLSNSGSMSNSGPRKMSNNRVNARPDDSAITADTNHHYVSPHLNYEAEVYRNSKAQQPGSKLVPISSDSNARGSKFDKFDIQPSNTKKSLTPIQSDRKASPTGINCRPFYHDVCKRPSQEKTKPGSESRSASLKRKQQNSKSPRGKDYFDKYPDFCVKQYRKIAGTPSQTAYAYQDREGVHQLVNTQPITMGGTDSRSFDKPNLVAIGPIRSRPQTPQNQTITITDAQRLNLTNQTLKTQSQLSNYQKTGVQLPDNQFCKFCNDYVHPQCFDQHFKKG